MPLLTITDLHVSYGAIKALHGVTLAVSAGQVVTLIGSNGAGKTTLLRAISQLVPAANGSIRFHSGALQKQTGAKPANPGPTVELTRLLAHEIVRLGVFHCPEGRGIFRDMSVLENLQLGAHLRHDPSTVAEDMTRMLRLFPVLGERKRQSAGTLSGGEQQMLAIARALMGRPKLLLLDEPSLGLAPNLVQEVFRIIRRINQDGVSILLVEQNAHMALAVANYAYVLENGQIRLEGPASELAGQDEVRKAYLGES